MLQINGCEGQGRLKQVKHAQLPQPPKVDPDGEFGTVASMVTFFQLTFSDVPLPTLSSSQNCCLCEESLLFNPGRNDGEL